MHVSHILARTCSVRCLEAELSQGTYQALIMGLPHTSATVGEVIRLYRQDRLGDIYNISTGRMGEIGRALTHAGLLPARATATPTRPLRVVRGGCRTE